MPTGVGANRQPMSDGEEDVLQRRGPERDAEEESKSKSAAALDDRI